VLAVALRDITEQSSYSRDDERDMTFMGFVTFLDRPKEGVADAIADLSRLGVSLKLITGDNALVARHVAGLVGLCTKRVLTGHQLDEFQPRRPRRTSNPSCPSRSS
jgi:Mg2+-importing ATPase